MSKNNQQKTNSYPERLERGKKQKSSQPIRVAINGLGRIGRAVFKIALENPKIKIVAINDLTDNQTLAHLLKYDSVYGAYKKDVSSDKKNLYVDKAKYPVYALPEPVKLPWKKLNVDVVLECTGRFVKDGAARAHIKAGAKKVIISAPAKGKGNVPTYLIGVNADKYQGENLISMASCTTNSIAPVTKIIDENFGIKQAFLTTIHSYTANQNLVDGPHKDLRRARAAAYNIVPTTTGATHAVIKAMPKLKDRFEGIAVRVPTICGSLSDLVYLVRTKTNAKKVNAVLKKASQTKALKGILGVTEEPLVSTDIIKSGCSTLVDLLSTQVLGGNLIKVLTWYDNEWAYSKRLVEMVEIVAQK